MRPNQIQQRARVYIDSHDVDVRLASLALSRDWIVESTRQGDLQRRLSSRLDFDGHGAYTAASRGLRTLCVQASGDGGHRGDYLGIPVMYNRDEDVAITVTGGDKFTGLVDEDRDPTTRAVKGPNTARAAHKIRKLPFGHSSTDDVGVSLWYMLTYAGDELRVEVSSPRVINHLGHVIGWTERIIVGRVDDDREYTKAPAPTSIEVNVRRKSS